METNVIMNKTWITFREKESKCICGYVFPVQSSQLFMITHRRMTARRENGNDDERRRQTNQNYCNLTFCHHQIRHNISLLSFFSFYHPSFSTIYHQSAWEMQTTPGRRRGDMMR